MVVGSSDDLQALEDSGKLDALMSQVLPSSLQSSGSPKIKNFWM